MKKLLIVVGQYEDGGGGIFMKCFDANDWSEALVESMISDFGSERTEVAKKSAKTFLTINELKTLYKMIGELIEHANKKND